MTIIAKCALAAALFGLPFLGWAAAVATAAEYALTVDYVTYDTDRGPKRGIGYNGRSPGPTLRLREGEDAVIKVTNNLDVPTSVHWHGFIVPYQMDGVPTISFDGIAPGETFTYRFPVVQSGTYWFHSHTGFQEPDGAYGSIIIAPKRRDPFRHDRDYVIVLKDAHPHSGSRIMRNLKMMPDYYNREQRTLGDFVRDAAAKGFGATLADRLEWGEMRMMLSDIEDVHGFTGLINGKTPAQNWTGEFRPGERIRLRIINASAMTYFDVRIPGLAMTVVQADGNNVQPVKVDEFRIAVAETYDVIVRPTEEKAFTIFAESMGRSGFARGTLAPAPGATAEMPARRTPPLLTMADMALAHGAVGHADHGDQGGHAGHGKSGGHAGHQMGGKAAARPNPFYAPGSGLTPKAASGGRFLRYADLKAHRPLYKPRKAGREIVLRLTGNMERYSWSINGVTYADAEPIRLRYGERVRFKFINETMMAHPMHLHGMWSILDTGSGKWNPAKHVVSIAPSTTVTFDTEVDAPGQWAFHCHLSFHAAAGMFRKVIVEGGPQSAALHNVE